MKKFLKFIKRNRVIVALSAIITLCLIICIVFGFKLFWGTTDVDKYGTRKDSLNDVTLTDNDKKAIDEYFLANKNVNSVKYTTQGPIIYITIDLKSDVALKTSKALVNNSLPIINKTLLEKYEFQFILTASSVKDSKIYPTFGYKALKKSTISWINS